MQEGYIYKITSPTNKVYIGQTINVKRRKSRYKSLDCKEQVKLYRSFNKYGFNSHLFEVIDNCDFNELNTRERYWQEFYNVIGENGLNCFYVQTNELKRVVSEDTREKIRKGLIGKTKSGPEHYRYGTKCTDEQKDFLSRINKGKKMPESAIQKMTGKNNPNYGKKLPEWHKKILSEFQKERFKDKSNHPFTGRKHYEEAKQKMSKSKKGKKLSEDWANKIADSIRLRYLQYRDKIVLDKEIGVYYYNCSDASRYNNIDSTRLSHMLCGRKKNKTNLIYV